MKENLTNTQESGIKRLVRSSLTLIFVLLLLTNSPLQCQSALASAPSGKDSHSIKSGSTVIVLKNGLRVILINQPAFPMISCQLWYHQGSSSELETRGACYALKHILSLEPMMKDKETAVGLIKRAAQFDSFVSHDFTTFVINGVKSDLEGCLKIQAGRLKADLDETDTEVILDGLAEYQRKTNLQKSQKGFPQLEEEVRALVTKQMKASQKSLKLPKVPVIQPVIKRVQTVKKVKEFYTESFKKAPVTLVVAGNFNSSQALKLIQKEFSGTRQLSPIKNTAPQETEKPAPKRPEEGRGKSPSANS